MTPDAFDLAGALIGFDEVARRLVYDEAEQLATACRSFGTLRTCRGCRLAYQQANKTGAAKP